MLKRWGWGLCLAGVLAGTSGCRCLPGLNAWGNVVDDVSDADWWPRLDNVYNPRFDISRAGRPDWCGPINSRLCPCRCLEGSWDRYDECHLHPPAYPYQYPAEFFGSVVGPDGTAAPPPVGPTPQVLPRESDEVEREFLPNPTEVPQQPPAPPVPAPPPLEPAPEPETRSLRRDSGEFEDSRVIPAGAQAPDQGSTQVRQAASEKTVTTQKPVKRSLLP